MVQSKQNDNHTLGVLIYDWISIVTLCFIVQ